MKISEQQKARIVELARQCETGVRLAPKYRRRGNTFMADLNANAASRASAEAFRLAGVR